MSTGQASAAKLRKVEGTAEPKRPPFGCLDVPAFGPRVLIFLHMPHVVPHVVARIREAVAELFAREPRVVLAVSGGVDSMVLLDAAAHVRPAGASVVVASFDHGTGAAASSATALVAREGGRRTLAVVLGNAPREEAGAHAGEAAWRIARWTFLRGVAESNRAVVATAHTCDDHLETVVMRIMRGAGARGLAALLAPSPVARPLLSFTRDEILAYATAQRLAWHDDPTNRDRRFLRNRVRLDLLPALRRVRPALPEELLALSRAAARIRATTDAVARSAIRERGAGAVAVSLDAVSVLTLDAHPLIWQSLAATAGITLDRRGTERLVCFATEGRSGTRIPLSGGFEAVRRDDVVVLRRRRSVLPPALPLRLAAPTEFGPWRFCPRPSATINRDAPGDPWVAWLPADADVTIRAWRDGDRVAAPGPTGTRRVKRFFSDRRIPAADREGWPVVLAGEEIIWIPGVRRADAAAVRSGRPAVCIVCERLLR